MYFKYTISETLNGEDYPGTATWTDGTIAGVSHREVTFTTAGKLTFQCIAVDNQLMSTHTLIVNVENAVTSVDIYYKLNNQTNYTLATADTTLTMAEGEILYLKYNVNGTELSDSTAIWSDDSSTTKERTITMTSTAATTTYWATAHALSTMKSYTITVDNKGALSNILSMFVVGYKKNGNPVLLVPEDSVIECISTDSIYVEYTIILNTTLSDPNSPLTLATWYLNDASTGDTSITKTVTLS